MEQKNQVVPFDFRGSNVRTIKQDGKPWFVAKDVCDVLGLSDVSMSLSKLDDDEKGTSIIGTLGGPQELSIINETSLYSLIIRSRKPEAKAFKRWVTHEVIPTIRKTGGAYLTAEKAEELLGNPDLVIGLAQQVKELREESRKKQEQIEEARPKVLFADAVSVSDTSILVGELAKLIKQNDPQELTECQLIDTTTAGTRECFHGEGLISESIFVVRYFEKQNILDTVEVYGWGAVGLLRDYLW